MALAAQGLLRPRPSGRVDVRHFRRVVDDVSLVQLDSVNVVARAHYLPFFSRLGPYPTDALDRWLWRSGEMFEYWGHEASVLPVRHRPLLRHRMIEGRSWWRMDDFEAEHPGYVQQVLAEVRRRGPVTVSDLEDPGHRTGPWWGYGKGKVALEHLFACGSITVADRPRFTRVYDLAERVHPPSVIEAPDVPRDEAIVELLALGARSHGVGTVREFADYHRLPIKDARRLMPRLVERGDVVRAEVEGWREPGFIHREAVQPRKAEARALLAPFDPLVWHRDRTERIFGFRYRIEIYVPAAKRVYGYYVLPFLWGDRLVARVDLKADRRAGRLLVRASHHEPNVDVADVAAALAAELKLLSEWLRLDAVVVEPVGPLAAPLAVEVGRTGSS